MTTSMLLAELGGRLGLEGLCFNNEGLCRLVFDEHLTIDLEQDDEHTMHIYAALCRLPADRREALYELLLAANLFGKSEGGSSFAIDPDTQEILLQARFFTQAADIQMFVDVLEGFVNDTERWKQSITRLLNAPVGTAEDADQRDRMLRV